MHLKTSALLSLIKREDLKSEESCLSDSRMMV